MIKKKNKNIKEQMNKNNKIKDYLLGGNDKLIGSIIGLKKKRFIIKNLENWKNDKTDIKYLPEGFAILLYFDHRTGKIERHLYHPNLTFFGKKPLINDYTQNIIQSRSTNYINPYVFNYNPEILLQKTLKNLINFKGQHDQTKLKILESEMSKDRASPLIEIDNKEFEHHPELLNNSYLSFKNLCDGKLTRFMYNLFILELSRDYLRNLNINIEKNEDRIKDLSLKDSITDMLKIRFNNEQTIKWLILDYPSNEELKEIYIPKHLFSIQTNEMFIKHFNIKLIPILIKESPPVIKDLKNLINSNTVLNNNKLSYLINKFNRTNIDRCIKILDKNIIIK